MKTPHLGQIVIYQISDGRGGMNYSTAMIVKLLPGSSAVNLKIFAVDSSHRDVNYDGISPVELGIDFDPRMQSNKWNLLESQF